QTCTGPVTAALVATSYVRPPAAQPDGASAVSELENHVAPRAETSSYSTDTPDPTCTATPTPTCVLASAFQLAVNAAPAMSKSHDSPGAAQAPAVSDCESWIAAAPRASIAGPSVPAPLGTTPNPTRVPSDERSASSSSKQAAASSTRELPRPPATTRTTT